MEKLFGEDDFQGLDKEIDAAVERLFVDKKKTLADAASAEPPVVREPSPKPPVLEPARETESFTEPTPAVQLAPEPSVPEPGPELEETIELKTVLEEAPAAEIPSLPPLSEPIPLQNETLDLTRLIEEPPVLPTPPKPPPVLEPLPEPQLTIEPKAPSAGPPGEPLVAPRPVSEPAVSPLHKLMDKLESQLLALEWEITQENLLRTKEAVSAFHKAAKDAPELLSVSGLMENLLGKMSGQEGDIRPPLIKFLMDAKETVKILMAEDPDRFSPSLRQLIQEGIQARFMVLRQSGMGGVEPLPVAPQPEPPAPRTGLPEEIHGRLEGLSHEINDLFNQIHQRVLKLEQERPAPPAGVAQPKVSPVNITVFRVGERLFGVESQKVLRLFKVPKPFQDKWIHREKIQLRDFEFTVVDLGRVLEIPGPDRTAEMKLLAVKGIDETKGFIVDEVLKKLSTHCRVGEGAEGYFTGIVRWTYQKHPVEIPILDPDKV